MTKTQIKQKLIKLAKNNKKGYPFSACVKINNREYFAVNEVTSKKDPTAHAEIQAIRLACKKENTENLGNGIIYSSNEPCPMCLTAIAWTEIKEVFYIYPYTKALENNYYYDRPSKRVNRYLGLKRRIKRL